MTSYNFNEKRGNSINATRIGLFNALIFFIFYARRKTVEAVKQMGRY
jgi:hypothetical protein